jgi:Z1 domain
MNPQDIIEVIKMIIRNQTTNETVITPSFFDDRKDHILSILSMIQPAVTQLDAISINNFYATAVKEYKSVYLTDIDPSSSLTKGNFTTWLTEERKNALPKDYIARYLTYMQNEGRSKHVLTELDRSSESILSKLGDPRSEKAFYTRGLVVGSVQSGKTGNFNAVINRAIDAGYNLIIILSGIMEDLRSQTQLRLETEVIGEGIVNLQTEELGSKGVGKITQFGVLGNSHIPQVFSITSFKSDFGKQVKDASFSLNNKNLLVCKKNTGVLKNLLIWLSDYLSENKDQHTIPLLIVDDEADNASLNNMGHKGREYASTINGHIRAILGLFSRKTYLGYTATPFANVIQDRNPPAEGLWPIAFKRNGETVAKSFRQESYIFPDDFIVLLETPSNYIGAKQIFDTTTDPDARKLPLLECIKDHLPSFPAKLVDTEVGPRPATQEELDSEDIQMRAPRKDDIYPTLLPESLKEAIECFILGIAIRLKRQSSMGIAKSWNPHNTMLIHVSRFTDWQNRTRELVRQEVETLAQRTLELPTSPNSIYARLERTWNKYYAVIVENIRTYLPDGYTDEFLVPVSFEEIKSLLPAAVQGIEVKAINNVTKEKLVYTRDLAGNGKKIIAIGGNRLSRGFTLEGLTINYFIRDTSFADTLLQMGRWFGYRPGYIDCCKLFTTRDAIEKFNAATRTIEELEVEFKRMERLKKTPQDFILRVQTYPGVLNITRPSILKNAKLVKWSYQDTLTQTTQFELNAVRISNAWTQLKALFRNNSFVPFRDSNFCIIDTDVKGLSGFLDCANSFYKFGDQLKHIKEFIDLCIKKDKLKTWRIAVRAKGAAKQIIRSSESGLPTDIELTKRSGPSKESGNYYTEFKENGTFTGSGGSANIVTTGRDMSLWLDADQIEKADKEFIAWKTADLIRKNDTWTKEQAAEQARKATKPERIYREKMSDQTGLLVIYLMDLREVFNTEDLKKVRDEKLIDETIPLIGYAIGIPPISGEVGGVYAQGDYNIEEDEQGEEPDEEILSEKEVEI